MDVEYKKSIVSYYDNTRLDYRFMWFRKNNRSVHFGYYDDNVQTHGDALMNLNRVMARKAGIKNGDKILDAGCGQGGSAIWMAENFDVEVTGITLVPHQVKIAEKEAEKINLNSRVKFYEEDYTKTRFKDESFSVIWACESLCHAQNKAEFYKEAHRLLKPGGRLIIAEYIRKERPLSNDNEKLLQDWLGGWSIKDIDTVSEHRQNAVESGFHDFKIEDITQFTRPSLNHLYSMASRLWNFGTVLKRIGLRNKINHGNHFGSIRQYEALERNLWFYGLLSAKKE